MTTKVPGTPYDTVCDATAIVPTMILGRKPCDLIGTSPNGIGLRLRSAMLGQFGIGPGVGRRHKQYQPRRYADGRATVHPYDKVMFTVLRRTYYL